MNRCSRKLRSRLPCTLFNWAKSVNFTFYGSRSLFLVTQYGRSCMPNIKPTAINTLLVKIQWSGSVAECLKCSYCSSFTSNRFYCDNIARQSYSKTTSLKDYQRQKLNQVVRMYISKHDFVYQNVFFPIHKRTKDGVCLISLQRRLSVMHQKLRPLKIYCWSNVWV